MATSKLLKPGPRTARWIACLLLLCVSPALAGSDLAELVDGKRYDELQALGPGIMPELAELYRGREDPEQRKRVAWAFYQLGWLSDDAAQALLPDIEGEAVDPGLRISAQYALGRVSNDPMVIEVLLRNLRHSRGLRIRDKAACALAYDQIHLKPEQKALLFRGLIGSLDDDKPDVRRIALQALKIHTGQSKGYDPNGPREQRLEAIGAWYRWLSEYESQL
jgi:HEAT repeat protein